MKKNDYCYLLITADELELPVLIADTLDKLAKMSGYKYGTLLSAFMRQTILDEKYKVIRVDFDEYDEEDEIEEDEDLKEL